MRERGYPGMSLEAVAARAGVGKTLYRGWPSRAALAVEAFFEATRAALAFPDTGSVREDFRQQIHELGKLLRSDAGGVFAGMLAGARTDAELRAALAQQWVLPRKAWGEERMRRARVSEVDAALAALYGPLYAPLLFGRPPLSEGEVEAYLTVVLRGVFG